jgi:rSAM/selenodomain-associated transferase 1
VTLCCAPDAGHPFFQQLARQFPLELRAQAAGDLGARLARAVDDSLARGRWPLLIGTDCPLLDAQVIASACEALQQGQRAVLAPAEDGGYVLLGLRQRAPELFQAIDWGSREVLAQTRQALGTLGWQWRELACLWDLDRPADLARYRRWAAPAG